ncbi:hypothetical protein NDU88_006622 [Pleurodeles waltl]|uniref:Uncharacterized protein n=1 Tax=Pleurodeles waltl TaxID=8319 RepID=A0AAV7VQ55_PLEWA|nr:hypothetical protein NDU88_006622 [Pleurodeles waltl]
MKHYTELSLREEVNMEQFLGSVATDRITQEDQDFLGLISPLMIFQQLSKNRHRNMQVYLQPEIVLFVTSMATEPDKKVSKT